MSGTATAIPSRLNCSKGNPAGVSRADRCRSAKSVDTAAHIARGLAAAHDKHIAHRDLKPNVFLTPTRGVNILDFGFRLSDECGEE